MEFLILEMTEHMTWMDPRDKELVIDDFIYLMIFCGNDFMPQIPFLTITNNAIQLIIDIYMFVFSFFSILAISSTKRSNSSFRKEFPT